MDVASGGQVVVDTNSLFIRRKSGRARNGAERDAGVITHAVKDGGYPSWDAALCGTTPGAIGMGWQQPVSNMSVTCPKCIKRMLESKG